MEYKEFIHFVYRSYIWDRRSPETIVATPALVPCRLKQKPKDKDEASLDQVDGQTKLKESPQPLQSLLNDLVSSQDPLDPLLINTKAVIHASNSSRNSSKRSSESDKMSVNVKLNSLESSIKSNSEKDSDYVPMMNNVNCCATSMELPENGSDCV